MGNAKSIPYIRTFTIVTLVTTLLCLFYFCSKPALLPEWIIGKWKTELDGTKIIESWQKTGNTLNGQTVWCFPKKKMIEKMKLFSRNGKLVYQVKIENKKVEFVSKKGNTNTEIVFENQKNDSPKRLIYRLISDKRIDAIIEDFPNDPNKTIFIYKRQ